MLVSLKLIVPGQNCSECFSCALFFSTASNLAMLLSRYKIVAAGAGRGHTVVVTDDGNSFAFGWNKHGQLGTGSAKNGKFKFVTFPLKIF